MSTIIMIGTMERRMGTKMKSELEINQRIIKLQAKLAEANSWKDAHSKELYEAELKSLWWVLK